MTWAFFSNFTSKYRIKQFWTIEYPFYKNYFFFLSKQIYNFFSNFFKVSRLFTLFSYLWRPLTKRWSYFGLFVHSRSSFLKNHKNNFNKNNHNK
jgi:hypothetical protein